MRKLFLLPCFLLSMNLVAQNSEEVDTADSTGLPGDHFSLQGALDLFKNSKSLEEFEQKLNTESNNVNNLDLNGDGDIDYVKVVDNMKDDVHAIVLQVDVSEKESQDVAVIELEKNGNESALVQIIGDEELYGDSIYVEPAEETNATDDGIGKGPAYRNYSPVGIIVNVWHWHCVKFVYAPAYVVWASPWRWHKYPGWWKPWRPHPWRWHHVHCRHYHHHYHHAMLHRSIRAHKHYGPHRKTSAIVVVRYKPHHAAYKVHKAKHHHHIHHAKPYKQPVNKQHSKSPNKQNNKVSTKPNNKPVNKGPKPNSGKKGGGGGGGKKGK